MKEITLHVEGMKCPACEPEVENAVKKLGGVRQVKVDYRNGKVEVEFEEDKVSVNDIVNAIEMVGYKVVGVVGA